MANPFDLAQTTFIFSWVSNFSSYKSAEPKNLAKYVGSCLKSTINNPFSDELAAPAILDNAAIKDRLSGGGWDLVWGPGVLTSEEEHAKNTAYMVENDNYYVLAIAGTDPHSFWDWIKEDARVGQFDNIDWDYFKKINFNDEILPDLSLFAKPANPSVQQVSLGTASGVKNILGDLRDEDGKRVHLVKFLEDLQKSGNTGKQLIVTGHSLGGALSPTVARYIKEVYGSAFTAVHAMPTAGPTPGNVAYQNAWNHTFPPIASGSSTVVKNLNENVFCTSDVVPHAWEHIWLEKVYGEEHISTMAPYFSGNFFRNIDPDIRWPLGNLTHVEVIATLGAVIPGASNNGKRAYMTNAANIVGFNCDFPNTYKLEKDHSGNTVKTPLNGNPNPSTFLEWMEIIAMIHVWSYGQNAFQIPVEFWEEINPRKVS